MTAISITAEVYVTIKVFAGAWPPATLLVAGFSLRQRFLAVVADVGGMGLHAVSDRSLTRLDVGAELLDVALASSPP